MTARPTTGILTLCGSLALAMPAFAQRPTFTAGNVFSIEPTVRMFGDVHRVTPTLDAAGDILELPRRRIGVQGNIRARVDFQVERELASDNPWRDAFADVRVTRTLQVRAGKFKMPFSVDQLTSASDRDFVYRSRVGGLLAPGRSIGASVHGRLAKRLVAYELGLFTRDGDIARFGENPGAGRTTAGRVTVRPLRAAGVPGDAGNLEIGVNATVGIVPEGPYSLRGRLASSDVFFAPVFVSGRRLRRGADVSWSPGRLSLQAEFLRVDDERIDQGIRGDTLPPLTAEGWYVASTWRVAGRRPKADAEGQRRRGLGRLDVAARLERLDIHTVASSQPAQRNPRAAHLLPLSHRAWTLGTTWHVNPWIRIQANLMREEMSDPDRSPIPGRGLFWTRVARLQFLL